MWRSTILAAALTAAPMYTARCAACHQGAELTGELPQGVRGLGAVDVVTASRFVAEHLEAMTGRAPAGGEAQQIVSEIRAWPPAPSSRRP